jgi:hypothetical protein
MPAIEAAAMIAVTVSTGIRLPSPLILRMSRDRREHRVAPTEAGDGHHEAEL